MPSIYNDIISDCCVWAAEGMEGVYDMFTTKMLEESVRNRKVGRLGEGKEDAWNRR